MPVFDWLVEWAGELITGALIGHDGMTAFRRLRGKDWTPMLAEFGEHIMARRPRALEQGHLEPRWDPGVYLGTRWGSVDHWIGYEDDTVQKAHAFKRMPESNRWERDRVLRILGLPNDPLNATGRPPNVAVEPEVVPAPQDEARLPQRSTRGFWITKSDLIRHGYSRGCLKCDAMRAGRETGTGHSPACRARFERLFIEEGDGRVERARVRREEAHPEPAVADVDEPGDRLVVPNFMGQGHVAEPVADQDMNQEVGDERNMESDGSSSSGSSSSSS